VRYDRRGYGRSRSLGTGDLAAHVDDLLAVLAGRPATVVGHSMGGFVALAAAARDPELVRSLLVYEAPAPWASWWPSPVSSGGDALAAEDEAEAFMRRAIGDRYWERLPARTREERRAEGPALQADLASLRGTPAYDPAVVEVPTIVACGSETTWWHRRAADELAAALPHAELSVVAGAQHGAHLSHPSAFARLVERAVERR
jgi:pimeloyl-ACP methyl ester carboxylesterase